MSEDLIDIEREIIKVYFRALGREPDDIGNIQYLRAVLNGFKIKNLLSTLRLSDEYKNYYGRIVRKEISKDVAIIKDDVIVWKIDNINKKVDDFIIKHIYIVDGFKDERRINETAKKRIEKYKAMRKEIEEYGVEKLTSLTKSGHMILGFYPNVVQNSGYGMLADNIYESLLKISSRYKYRTIDSRLYTRYMKSPLHYSDISLILGVPLGFFKTSAKINIGYTMFEATKIPKTWDAKCNIMDMLFLPCKSNVDTFKNCGVEIPIEIIPIGINANVYNPNITNKNFPFIKSRHPTFDHIDSAYKFLVINDGQNRKNNNMIVDAFQQEFKKEIDKKEVYLVIRTKMPRIYKGNNIYIVDRFLLDNELKLLINSCDCMISASSGEAGDIPILSGMAMEKPVIASREFVHTEYIEHEKTGFLIDTAKLVPAYRDTSYRHLSFYGHLYADTMWMLPSIESLKKNMRYVYDNRDIAKDVGTNARKYILENRTVDMAVTKMFEIFDDVTRK